MLSLWKASSYIPVSLYISKSIRRGLDGRPSILSLEDNKKKLVENGPATGPKSKQQMNGILISHRFADLGEICKIWYDSGLAVSRSTTLRRFHQFRIWQKHAEFEGIANFYEKKKKNRQLLIWGETIKFGGAKSFSQMNQNSVFSSVILAFAPGGSYTKDTLSNAWKKVFPQSVMGKPYRKGIFL